MKPPNKLERGDDTGETVSDNEGRIHDRWDHGTVNVSCGHSFDALPDKFAAEHWVIIINPAVRKSPLSDLKSVEIRILNVEPKANRLVPQRSQIRFSTPSHLLLSAVEGPQ